MTAPVSTTPFRLPRLYPIIDTALMRESPLTAIALARILIDAGVRILQYRHKRDWLQQHFDEASSVADLCNEAGVLFVLNDRADYAKLLRAALHVGQDDLPPKAARKVIGDEVMGLSTHNRIQLQIAEQQDVEYLSIGPIFDTSSKEKPDPALGVEGLRPLRPLTTKPLCAIGGITLERARGVLEAGADSVAFISGLLPPEPALRWNAKAIGQLVRQWIAATTAV